MDDEGRLAGTPAKGNGREVRRVRLHEDAVVGHVARRGAHRLGGRERRDARERHHESPVEQLPRERGRARVGVDHAAQAVSVPPRHLVEDAARRVVCLARMDDDRQPPRVRQRELLRLRYEENMTVTEIAAAIGRDKSTVSRTLSRARRRLYKCLRYGL